MVTPGPASWTERVLVTFLDLGVRSFRFPFAKEAPSTQLEWGRVVRALAAARGLDVVLVADLPGGKPRLSNETAIRVETDERFSIQTHLHSARTDCDLRLSPFLDPSDCAAGTALIG